MAWHEYPNATLFDSTVGNNYMYMQYMYVSLPPGKIFAPEMQKRALKNKKEPLKIAIDCNVKACSMLQI